MNFVSSVVVPLTNKDSVEYDALGNVTANRAPTGHWTVYQRDVLGRDSLVQVPVDTLDLAKAAGSFSRTRTTTLYDVAGLVKQVTTVGAGTPMQQLVVDNFYDYEGNLTEVWRRSDPDPANVKTIKMQFVYDAAGRKVKELADNGQADSTGFDPAGNVTFVRNRNADIVTMQYDALNRLAKRITPAKSLPSETWLTWSFPLYAASIPVDTAVFGYDSTGMIQADNGDARIARAYNPNGSLRTESQRIRTYAGADFTRHVFNLAWTYDGDGRRTSVALPRPEGPPVPQSYAYVPTTGELQSVAGFTFLYDNAARLSQTVKPGSITETNTYDTGGRLIRRQSVGTNYFIISPPGASTNVILADTLKYDAGGRILSARTKLDSAVMVYSGLGAVKTSNYVSRWNTALIATETFTTDAFANLLSKSVPFYDPVTFAYDTLGRLVTTTNVTEGSSTTNYDNAGNAIVIGRYERTPNGSTITAATRSYYGADNRLRVVDRRISPETQQNPHNASPDQRSAFEEYRYDALGRRVLKRSRRWQCPAPCEGAIERYVWDGDDLALEFRYPGREGIPLDSLEASVGAISKLDTTNGQIIDPDTLRTYSPYYGVAAYFYAGVIDRPLSMVRWYYGVDSLYYGNEQIILHYDWRGNVLEGTRYNGTATASLKMNWPSEDMQVYRNLKPRSVLSWVGNVPEQSRDASGLLYMRNRYYDPVSGRFTQEDPIGLNGGMNLYGFAAGDPVNMSDPFGLDPYINCRPVGGTGNEGAAAHCAVRVVDAERKLDVTIELLDVNGKNEVFWRSAPGDMESQGYAADSWVKVATPKGMSTRDFDNAVLNSALSQTVARRGKDYDHRGATNSNRFVFSVIRGAGGSVPGAAGRNFIWAPGLCGGAGYRKGKCAP